MSKQAARNRTKPKEAKRSAIDITPPTRRNAVNLLELAYERLEHLIVTCELRPGAFLTIQDLQDILGFSRTPVHQAVARLAIDTLMIVRPRHGLQVAPMDLARERLLLKLRRDLERFVIRLAAERSSSSHRNQMLHLARYLRERRDAITIGEFNAFDWRIDQLILAAAGEPFLEHTLRPLHTIFRRIGWIYHNRTSGHSNISETIDAHLSVLDAVVNRDAERAVLSSDSLIDFVDSMFDVVERDVDPEFLDCTLEPILPTVSSERQA
ncbi:GntR family transcriptional regulator [Chelativorans salis]|uniref:GntR family transcriptional regulator n=1 Tax=Chelativorans salis TaxID=2978478 RepID=A0ABT2LV18_9HYPH|nr:GntR family transcriptional regulator [Chelativorans sp. EGI FJ00035]MCT7377939.1 GntR family transcriptional regulator [Chelativorans sp. EGI FJ00035]